jgi:hypothetical protein
MITPQQIKDEEVRALWWKQPYGSMMLFGKDETRKWDTKYRGLVLICCSRQPYSLEELSNMSTAVQRNHMDQTFHAHGHNPDDFNGKAIAIGRLFNTMTNGQLNFAKTYVRYSSGLFVHVYKDVIPVEPFEFKGMQGWKKLSAYEKSRIKLKL